MTDLLPMEAPSYPDYVNYSARLSEDIIRSPQHAFNGHEAAATLFPFWNSSFINGSNWDAFHNESRSQNNTEPDLDFTLPVWRQVVWSILFGGMVIVATGGNLIVIWIVLAHKRMRTVTNYFLVNLSIADAMVSLLNVTFNYTYMLNNNWPFGRIYCKICQFVAILSISASVFTLMAIAVDRYMAIMNPLRPRMGKRTTLCITVVIWIVSFILSGPMLYVFTTFDMPPFNGAVRVVCYSEWPDGATTLSTQETMYNVVFMFLTYFLPIGLMSYTYARVGSELWGSQSIGECTQRQLENIKSKRRVVKMMMVVVLIFAICWLPYHIYFIVQSYVPELTNEPYIQELYLGIYWLAMSNSMYNPIIYCWMNSRFRRGFQMFFRWCPFVHLTPESLSRRDVVGKYSCNSFPDHHRITRNDMERSFYYSCTGTQRAGSQRIPMHHSCLKATPSSSTMMTSVTTNTSLPRMQSVGAINNNTQSTDTHLGGQYPLTATSANTSTTSCHVTAGVGHALQPGTAVDSLLIAGPCAEANSKGDLIKAQLGGRNVSNGITPNLIVTGTATGLAQQQKPPPQPFIRWATNTPASAKGAGASNDGESGVVAATTPVDDVVGVRKSFS